jgi:hypothetical protein
MVVSPVRAVLEVHLAATWNRSTQELGKAGALVFALVMGLLLVVGGGPVVVGSTLFGWLLLGPRLREPDFFAPFLGATLALLLFFGGVVGGIMGGSRTLAWESYRVFPLRLPALFAAELAASLGDPLCLAMALMSGFLLLGVGLANPAVLPLIPLIWIGTVGSMLCLQHLIGSLAARAVKRFQVGLILLAVLGWTGLYLFPTQTATTHRPGPTPTLEVQIQRLRGFGPRLGQVLSYLPTSQAAKGLSAAAQGRWSSALGQQAPLLATLLLLLLFTSLTLRREADQESLRVQLRTRSPERLWSFSTPRMGVARLHWQNLLGSHLRRFSLLVPLMTLVLLKGPLGVAKGIHVWALPAAFGYLALTGIQFQMNQFGLDGPGVKVLLLLPLKAEELLLGKFWGLAAYQSLQAALLLALLGIGGVLTGIGAAAGLCLAGCLFLTQVACGHWTSAWLPRPIPRDSLKNSSQSPLVVWLSMVLGSAAVGLFGGPYLLAAWLAPALLLPLMLALFLACALAYWRLILPHAARYLDRRRETLVNALG